VASLTELAPQAYQTDPATGQPQPVACHYRLSSADSTVTFALGQYDRSRPLVIDPTVQFSTYTGARGDNWGFTATYDAAGNIYVASVTSSRDFPTTSGSFGTTGRGGTSDAVVLKLPAALNTITWSGYLGGNAADAATCT
jgi:hypothetical protein